MDREYRRGTPPTVLSSLCASYSSPYLSFTGVETRSRELQDGQYAPLDSLSPADAETVQKLNAPPYVSAGDAGAIPFMDLAGRYVQAGSSYSPAVLTGHSADQIAGALADGNSPTAKAIDGTANVWTAAICDVTGGKPGNVCQSAAVTAVRGKVTGAH